MVKTTSQRSGYILDGKNNFPEIWISVNGKINHHRNWDIYEWLEQLITVEYNCCFSSKHYWIVISSSTLFILLWQILHSKTSLDRRHQFIYIIHLIMTDSSVQNITGSASVHLHYSSSCFSPKHHWIIISSSTLFILLWQVLQSETSLEHHQFIYIIHLIMTGASVRNITGSSSVHLYYSSYYDSCLSPKHHWIIISSSTLFILLWQPVNNQLEKGIIDKYSQAILNAARMMTQPKSKRVRRILHYRHFVLGDQV